MANQWLRLWHDMPNDPKWRTIARASRQPISAVIAVYVHLLVDASANANERGRTHSLHAEDVASALDMETEQIEAILAAMQGRVLSGDRLTGWDKRQPAREDGSAERARAWRAAKREAAANANERNRTQPNAEERPDKDKDKELSPSTRVRASVPDGDAGIQELPPGDESAVPEMNLPEGYFCMYLGWWPDKKNLAAYAMTAGLRPEQFTQDTVSPFVLYHQPKGTTNNQAGWVSDLVRWVKKDFEHKREREARLHSSGGGRGQEDSESARPWYEDMGGV